MSAFHLGTQYVEARIIFADAKARAADPLAYDKDTLQRMAAVFDAQVRNRTARIDVIKTRMAKRASLVGKKDLGAVFAKLAHDIKHTGNYSDKNLLGSAAIFSSSRFNIEPSLATAVEKLDTLKETTEYKNLVFAAKKSNVHIAIAHRPYGHTLDIDVTKNFDGSPKQFRAQPALKSTP